MRDPEWVSLTDAERGQLVAMWLLAADKEGVIPASPVIIQKLCFLSKQPNINRFIELNFIESGCIQDDVDLASSGSQDDQPKAKADAKAEAKAKTDTDTRKPEKVLHLDDVRLLEDEYKKLIEKLGSVKAERCIQVLNDYKMSNGKKYKSDYHTMFSWVIKRVEEDGTNKGQSKIDHYGVSSDDRPYEDDEVFPPD